MTYAQIKAAVAAIRGDQGSLGTDAIRDREVEVWQYNDWPIKQSIELSLTVTGGVATVAVPSGFSNPAQGLHIYDDYGDELDYLAPADFFASYGASPASPVANNRPEAWTLVVDPTASGLLSFRLGPTPLSGATFSLQGWNLPIKRTDATHWSIGTMSADTDLPWWPDDYHGFLVDGAVAQIKRRFGDPSYGPDEGAFQAGLTRLAHELQPAARGAVEVWGEC